MQSFNSSVKTEVMRLSFIIILFLTTGVVFTSCKKDFNNPNAPLVDDVLSTPAGITSVSIGLQRTYATTRVGSIYNIVAANGFSSYELINRNTGNVDETNLNTGGNAVDGNNNVLNNLWTTNLKVIFEADRVINAAKQLGDKNYAAGLIGHASVFKALALGSLSMFWQQVPDTVGVGLQVGFINRVDGFRKVVAVLDEAIAFMAANPPSGTVLNLLTPGFDLTNTPQALKARYALFAGDYTTALAAANNVNLTVRNEIRFDNANQNPIYQVSTSTNNVFQVVDSTFGLPLDLRPVYNSDKRIPFYMTITTTAAPRWRISGFGAAINTVWPVYLPGEITLIKAEAQVRKPTPSLVDAIVEINKIRTKTPAADPFGVGADEGFYAGAVTADALLTEIYRQRCIELYMQGFKMEDMRRFGRSNTPNVEKKRNFFPYPFRERDNNPNTPDDPAF